MQARRLKALKKVDIKQGFSYFTETVRHHKAQVFMYRDKMRDEFPLLKEYALPYQPLKEEEKAVKYIRTRTIYPGLDGKCIDPEFNTCKIQVPLSSYGMELQKSIKIIAGKYYDSPSDSITLECRRFDTFEENKKWIDGCLERLVESANSYQFEVLNLEQKKIEFPQDWKWENQDLK
jgi:hypothetical protein